jgi:hypothetical protein
MHSFLPLDMVFKPLNDALDELEKQLREMDGITEIRVIHVDTDKQEIDVEIIK